MKINGVKKIILSDSFKRSVAFNEYNLACLDGNDVISQQVSDHHPVIHNDVLFWNVMMPGAKRREGYNNGFKIVEDDKQYVARLSKIANVIAEIVYRYPAIDAITLCEGPIRSDHLLHLFSSIKEFPWMIRLTASAGFHKPNIESKNHWGLLMLADKKYQVNKIISCGLVEKYGLFEKLANRFQIWELAGKNNHKYLSLAHFPFSGDEYKTSPAELSNSGKKYCDLTAAVLRLYSETVLVFCADFNINPFLITEYQQRFLDKIPLHNSVLSDTKLNSVTVDGILLSNQGKRLRYSFSPEAPLFFKKIIIKRSEENQTESKSFIPGKAVV